MDLLQLTDRMLDGDRRALARLITCVENDHENAAEVLERIHPRCGRAYTIGITGPPGAGKSTLVDALVSLLREGGHSVGVLAIDPSSPFSGGAVLGDRIRMQRHYLDDQVFIRSLSSRGSHGGLARATRNVARLLDAFGAGFVLIETVGVGQTELDVMGVVDTTVVVLVPEAGDAVQTMKAGLLEIADIFVVNKSDREGAMKIKSELEAMLHLRPSEAWNVPVLSTEAHNGKGIDDLLTALGRHREYLDSAESKGDRAPRRREEFLLVMRDEVGRRLTSAVRAGRLDAVLAKVESGEIDPYAAAIAAVDDSDAVLRLLAKNPEP